MFFAALRAAFSTPTAWKQISGIYTSLGREDRSYSQPLAEASGCEYLVVLAFENAWTQDAGFV
jgi:hypothetical protein